MAVLVTLQGPEMGRQFPLSQPSNILGRQLDCTVCLEAKAVSRQHAQILNQNGKFLIEDLDSSNGTYLNGKRINPRMPTSLNERDTLQIGPYVFTLRAEPIVSPSEESLVIRDQVDAIGLEPSLYGLEPSQILHVVLEISQHLARTLDMDELLNKLLAQLLILVPHADRCMILFIEGENLVVRGQLQRNGQEVENYPYSRTVVNRALTEGIGILSEDVKADQRFNASATLTSLNLRSLICVPLICQDGRRLGIIQVDHFRDSRPFRKDDLQLLTTISHQVAIALDNANLHAELLREERFRQELALAREIQQGFFPTDFDDFVSEGFELFARVDPAREVSGDLYDFTRLADGRLAFFVGDVSGKGMPAALFMVAVRTLGRHMAAEGLSPATTLAKLNSELAEDNTSGMFVTLAHGIVDLGTGELILASGGHHLPILRRGNGTVEALTHRTGRLLGYNGLDLRLSDMKLTMEKGDLLVFFTDGYTEAKSSGSKEMFGLDRLRDVVRNFTDDKPLPRCAMIAREAIQTHTGGKDQQDDLTLFLLRRSKDR